MGAVYREVNFHRLLSAQAQIRSTEAFGIPASQFVRAFETHLDAGGGNS